MMILTDCDDFIDTKLDKFFTNLRNHHLTKRVLRFCQLGVCYHGIINYDELATYEDDSKLYNQIFESKRKRVLEMHKKFIDTLTTDVQKIRNPTNLAAQRQPISGDVQHIQRRSGVCLSSHSNNGQNLLLGKSENACEKLCPMICCCFIVYIVVAVFCFLNYGQ